MYILQHWSLESLFLIAKRRLLLGAIQARIWMPAKLEFGNLASKL